MGIGIKFVGAASLIGVSVVALPAVAQDADALAEEGVALMEKGDYEHACPKLFRGTDHGTGIVAWVGQDRRRTSVLVPSAPACGPDCRSSPVC